MKIQSPAFQRKGMIPQKYTCDGSNVSPSLLFSGIPKSAQSITLIVDDIDSKAGRWLHWLVWNIPADTLGVLENLALPEGAIEGRNDFGKSGYGGPCPELGEHRYVFRAYALDVLLDVEETATRAEIERAMDGHVLAQSELVGVYERKKKAT